MNTHTSLGRRLVAALGAAALGLVGVVGVANAAVGPDQPNHPTTGTLTIHKLDGAQGAASDGTEQNVAGTPLNGVKFTIWQLGTENGEGTCVALNTSTIDDWDKVPTGAAPATTAQVEAAGYCLVNAGGTTGTTAGQGAYTFSGLDLGLYYVQETDSSGATNATTGKSANVVSESAPFYVSIPLPTANDWLYDVHAYPKNQTLDAPVKTINDDAAQPGNGVVVGSVVEWTITQKVPALNDGESYNSASIWDVLPASLAYNATKSVTLNGETLTEGADYKIDADGVTWTLTGALDDIKAGDVITVTFTTKVLSVTATGDIANPGSNGDEPGYGSEFNGTKTPGEPTPYTYWGQLSILKTDDSTPVKNLAGAEFKVFLPAADDTCAATAPTDGSEVATGTSNASGIVEWEDLDPDANNTVLGLWVANSENGALTDPSKNYCVYETVVPAGHTAVPFTTKQTIKPGTDNVNAFTVVNSKKNGPDLPLTGANGQLLALIGGGALVLLAGGTALVARNRRHQNQD